MMLGERTHHLSPTIQVPPWPVYDDIQSPASSYAALTASIGSPPSAAAASSPDLLSPYLLNDSAFSTALQRFLPSNDLYLSPDSAGGGGGDEDHPDATAPVDAYSCDEFRMYEFKVRRCARGRSHDWTECPYAHPGEKARRRDPRKYHYSGTACPDFRKGSCKRGDSCEFAHGVFECWLHPARYRTQPCKDGIGCRRRVCFFAHTPEQLRVLPHSTSTGGVGGGGCVPGSVQSPRSPASASAIDSYDGSPLRKQHQQQQQQLATLDAYFPSSLSLSSPSSGSTANNSNLIHMSPPLSPPSGESPPLSPSSGASPSSFRRASLPSPSINDIVASLRQLQLCKAKSAPSSWGSLQQQQQQMQQQVGSVSPRGATALTAAPPYPVSGYSSLPSTPTRLAVMNSATGSGLFDGWGEEQPMERVESGRDLRARLAEKLTKENPLECSGSMSVPAAPDVDWVSELLM